MGKHLIFSLIQELDVIENKINFLPEAAFQLPDFLLNKKVKFSLMKQIIYVTIKWSIIF